MSEPWCSRLVFARRRQDQSSPWNASTQYSRAVPTCNPDNYLQVCLVLSSMVSMCCLKEWLVLLLTTMQDVSLACIFMHWVCVHHLNSFSSSISSSCKLSSCAGWSVLCSKTKTLHPMVTATMPLMRDHQSFASLSCKLQRIRGHTQGSHPNRQGIQGR